MIHTIGPGTDGAAHQRDVLLEEGIEVTEAREGSITFRVSLARYGWFPTVQEVERMLESQLMAEEEEEEDGEED